VITDAPARYRDAAITRLITSGVLTDPAWRDALRDLPRDRFLSAFYAPARDLDGAPGWLRSVPATAPGPPGERSVADPLWLGAVHGPDPLVVALSGLDGWGRQVPVSLSPAPAATVTMLQALAARPGHRVLELGTGVGHTAALLAHRLGSANVTSVEIDPDLHRLAATRLNVAGLRPALTLGDSAEHCDPHGYDRVLVAHHIDHVPPAWLGAVRPGGQVLLGLRGGLGAGHHALLHQQTDAATGATALSGRFLDWTATLPAHRHPARRRALRRPLDPTPGPIRSATTSLPVDQLTANTPFALLCQLHLPSGTTQATHADAAGGRSSYLHAPDGSWAEIAHTVDRGGRRDVRWAGVTTLPQLLDAALEAYHDLGSPGWTDLGLIATTRGTRIWHEPTGTSWPLPSTGSLS
jgi:protein-L-isoaspartate O-methyltransferase